MRNFNSILRRSRRRRRSRRGKLTPRYPTRNSKLCTWIILMEKLTPNRELLIGQKQGLVSKNWWLEHSRKRSKRHNWEVLWGNLVKETWKKWWLNLKLALVKVIHKTIAREWVSGAEESAKRRQKPSIGIQVKGVYQKNQVQHTKKRKNKPEN